VNHEVHPKREEAKKEAQAESQMEFHFDIELISVEVFAENDFSQNDIGIFQKYMGPN